MQNQGKPMHTYARAILYQMNYVFLSGNDDKRVQPKVMVCT